MSRDCSPSSSSGAGDAHNFLNPRPPTRAKNAQLDWRIRVYTYHTPFHSANLVAPNWTVPSQKVSITASIEPHRARLLAQSADTCKCALYRHVLTKNCLARRASVHARSGARWEKVTQLDASELCGAFHFSGGYPRLGHVLEDEGK